MSNQDVCIHWLVEAQVRRTPHQIAVEHGRRLFTYAQLNDWAEHLAAELRRLGVRPEAVVGLLTESSPAAIAAMLGIMKAGGAYLPLDPRHPEERLRFVLHDADAAIVVAASERPLPADLPVLPLYREPLISGPVEPLRDNPALIPDNLAYILFTSGSTGRPKGVAMAHRALVNSLREQVHRYPAPARTLQFAPLGFDVSFQEIFYTLSTGGTLVLVPPDVRADGTRLARLLIEARVERIFMPYVALNELAVACGEIPVTPPLREIVTAGEALHVTPAIERLLTDTGAALENHYGPTETHVTTWERLTGPPASWPRLPPIGFPVPGIQTFVTDSQLRQVPQGKSGELYVGGVGLARGYANRPALTAERFLPDPFSGERGARVYATGDLVRALPDGRLEFLGRADDQVKIRGNRVELGEIEQVLSAHPGIAECAVVAPADERGWRRLIAHIVVRQPVPSAEEVRAHLAARLPEYMLPGSYQIAERLPRTSTGKLDRRLLESIVGRPPSGEPPRVPPRNEVERHLCEIWAEVLRRPVDNVEATLIDVGGDSLIAARVVARLRTRLGAEIDVATVLTASIIDLAARIGEFVTSSRAVSQVASFSRPPLLPLSSAQRRFWLFDQLHPGSPAYNISWRIQLTGTLSKANIERSLAEVIRRHEVLRTTFGLVGEAPVQVVTDVVTLSLPCVDLSHAGEHDQTAALAQLSLDDRNRSFDLSAGPLIRTLLVRLGPERHWLLATLHHIIADRWSLELMEYELRTLLAAFSAGRPSPLAAPPLQYADHTLLERERLADDVLEPLVERWAGRLRGLPGTLDLPTDHPRTATPAFDSGSVDVEFDSALTAGIMDLTRAMRVTPFAVLLAALGVLLSRHTGQRDLCIGSPASGRELLEHEDMLGCFINTLPLRIDLHDRPTFSEAARRVKETVLDAMAHQAVPFETLVERLRFRRDPLRPPLVQVMFIFDGPETAPSTAAEQGTGLYDLTLWLRLLGDRLTGAMLYRREIFEYERIAALTGHLEVLLRAAVSAPETPVTRLPMLTRAERIRLVKGWNATTRPVPRQAVHELFAARANAQPDAIALAAGERTMTYGQLRERSERLAVHLRQQGIAPERLVAVCTRDEFDLITAIFGILMAGGAFLLIDPTYPRQRVAYMLADADPPLALADNGLLDGLTPACCRLMTLDGAFPAIDGAGAHRPAGTSVHTDNLAYVVYTSGSTGRPKGIQVAHTGLANLAVELSRLLRIHPGSRVVRFASPSFDATIAEVFPAMTAGATLLISPRDRVMPGPEFTDDLRSAGATAFISPPSVLAQLDPADVPLLANIMSAGEACHAKVAEPWLEGGRHLVNCYGPSEATVATTAAICDLADLPPPIGHPIANMRVYVVDPEFQLVPPGVVGELAIGGIGLARGYLRQPALTAQRLVPDPFSGNAGARLYLTGDLASLRRDGTVDYHGRADRQVKVRGVRVELGEIEATLSRHPLVRECAVVTRTSVRGDIELVACIALTRPDQGVDELRIAARAWLPPQMVPSAFAVFARLPLTPSGKVDRILLSASATEQADEPLPVVTRVQRVVARAWQAVLGSDRPVGRDTNFFDCGGHSLLVMQVVSRLRDELGIAVPMRALFEAPALEAFAGLVEQQIDRATAPAQQSDEDSGPVARRSKGDALPMSFFQEWRFRADLGAAVPLYNIALGFEITGELKVGALHEVIGELVRRHEPLRTNYDIIDGRPVQVIHSPSSPDLPVADLRSLPESRRWDEAMRLMKAEAARPDDRRTAAMFRPLLVKLADDRHLLLLRSDRIAIDGTACCLVTDDLSALYASAVARTASGLELPGLQQADWASWQRERLRGNRLEELVAYWRGKLDGSRPLLEIPLPDGAKVPSTHTFRGRWTQRKLGPDLSRELRRRARDADVTLFIYLLAVLKVFVARLAGADEATVVCPFANRTRRELEKVVGCFAHGVIYRTDLSGDPHFADVVSRVRDVCLEAWEHQELPVSEVARHIRPHSYLTLYDEFHVFFDVVREQPRLRLPDVSVTPVPVDTGVGHPSLAVFLEDAEDLELLMRADADRFDSPALDWMIKQLSSLVAAATREPATRISRLLPWNVPQLPDRREHKQQ